MCSLRYVANSWSSCKIVTRFSRKWNKDWNSSRVWPTAKTWNRSNGTWSEITKKLLHKTAQSFQYQRHVLTWACQWFQIWASNHLRRHTPSSFTTVGATSFTEMMHQTSSWIQMPLGFFHRVMLTFTLSVHSSESWFLYTRCFPTTKKCHLAPLSTTQRHNSDTQSTNWQKALQSWSLVFKASD